MKNRDRNELLYQMLKMAEKQPITKTKIMYGAYLSTMQLRDYIRIVVDGKLLSYDQQAGTFSITGKGLHFIQLHENLTNLFNIRHN